jgi:hypothetical protein
MQTQQAASSHATMPLLAINRKDTGWQIDWQERPGRANPASKRFQYGGIVADGSVRSRNRGHIAS